MASASFDSGPLGRVLAIRLYRRKYHAVPRAIVKPKAMRPTLKKGEAAEEEYIVNNRSCSEKEKGCEIITKASPRGDVVTSIRSGYGNALTELKATYIHSHALLR